MGVILGAAVFRIALVLTSDRIVWGDEPFYLWLGRNWLTGQGYTFTGYHDVHHTPLLPLLSGLLYLVIGDLETASNLLYIVCGALLAVPVYLIAREMYGRPVAVMASVLVSVWPALTFAVLYWGTNTEPLYFLVVYSGIFCGLAGLRDHQPWAFALAGVFFALAYLTRPEAVGYLVFVLAFIALVRLAERRLFTRRTLTALALVLLGYLALFLPYAYYVRQHTGEWMVSEKAGVTYVTSKSLAYGDTVTFDRLTWGLDSSGQEVYFFSPESYNVSMIEVIAQDPMDFVKLVYMNVRRFADSLLALRMFAYWLLPLLAAGWLRRPWTVERLKAELYLLVAISPVLGFLVFFVQDRYIAAMLPGLIIWSANGLKAVQDWLSETISKLTAGGAGRRFWTMALLSLPCVLLLAFLAYTVPDVVSTTHSGSWRSEHKLVGLWLRSNTPPGGVLMSRYPAIAFYAHKRWVATPNAPVADVLRYASGKGATYWVVDERETVKLRPQFAQLVAGTQSTPNLRTLHVDTSSPEKIAVFALSGANAPP